MLIEGKNCLQELDCNQSRDNASCSGDSRNDLAGDQLASQAIRGCNIVVFCTQIARRGDEVHMEVTVVILLKLDHIYAHLR